MYTIQKSRYFLQGPAIAPDLWASRRMDRPSPRSAAQWKERRFHGRWRDRDRAPMPNAGLQGGNTLRFGYSPTGTRRRRYIAVEVTPVHWAGEPDGYFAGGLAACNRMVSGVGCSGFTY